MFSGCNFRIKNLHPIILSPSPSNFNQTSISSLVASRFLQQLPCSRVTFLNALSGTLKCEGLQTGDWRNYCVKLVKPPNICTYIYYTYSEYINISAGKQNTEFANNLRLNLRCSDQLGFWPGSWDGCSMATIMCYCYRIFSAMPCSKMCKVRYLIIII